MDIDTVMRKHEDRIMRLPNVTGIGIGEKDGRPVIKVFVSRKLPGSELAEREVIPRMLDGYPTDVEETGVVSVQPDTPK